MNTQQILNLIFAFIVSFIFTFATTPLARRLAFKIGAVDVPRDKRRMHTKPTPRIGGVAIVFGFMVAAVCFSDYSESPRQLISMLIGLSIIVALGIVDDCKNLDARLKFVFQIIAALIVVLVGQVKINVITNPNLLSDQTYIEIPQWLSVTLSVLWIVFITNAVNFIDGLDGLAAGVSAIMSVSLVFIAIRLGDYSVAVLGIAIMGSCFGFLPFNFNPAKIFMGDTGSTFLGFMLASLSVQGVFKSYAVISFAVPLLILGLPLFDASFAMVRRILHGQSPMSADRGHLHHRLIDMGFSQKQTVFILYAISGVLGIAAVLLAESGALRALLLVICVLIFILIGSLLGKNSYVHHSEHNNSANRTEKNESYEKKENTKEKKSVTPEKSENKKKKERV